MFMLIVFVIYFNSTVEIKHIFKQSTIESNK